MADRVIEILTPGTNFDLITLTEAKLLMGLSLTDTSDDQQLQLFISINSLTVAGLCNRTFAYEEVRECWGDLAIDARYYPPVYSPYYPEGMVWPNNAAPTGRRIFLSHWPVVEADIESVESPPGNVLDPSVYVLEEKSGKLECLTGAWIEPVIVTYSGGYNLPDEADLPLKQAVALLNVQSKLLASLGAYAGIRLLGHKEARVAFQDPVKMLEAAMGGAGSPTHMAVMNILRPYLRLEV
jgi:hypothetical protein